MSEEPVAPEVLVNSSSGKEERLYAAACHFTGLPIFAAVGLANFIAPLLIWLIKKDSMPLVEEHGKESLNFQITVLIAYGVATVTFCLGIGIGLFPVIAVLHIVFPIIGGIAAYDGKPYRYPLTLRLVQ